MNTESQEAGINGIVVWLKDNFGNMVVSFDHQPTEEQANSLMRSLASEIGARWIITRGEHGDAGDPVMYRIFITASQCGDCRTNRCRVRQWCDRPKFDVFKPVVCQVVERFAQAAGVAFSVHEFHRAA